MRIVVNNFFYGVLKRGIPIYTSELVAKLREEGVEVKELRCPKFLYGLPTWIHNFLFIIYDQIITPLFGLFHKTKYNIYPYNSLSLIDLFTNKPIIIIHDFISLNKNKKNISACYVRFCILSSSNRIRNVILISNTTAKLANKLSLFSNARQILLPNTFFSFKSLSDGVQKEDHGFLLLVSGMGKNKDIDTALELYFSIPIEYRIPLKILGCGGGRDVLKAKIHGRDEFNTIEILKQIPLEDVVKLYAHCKFVWAHSLAEGYGRALAEGKISGKNILCTRIPAFIEQDNSNVFYYNDAKSFQQHYFNLIENTPVVDVCELKEHIKFSEELKKIYEQ